YDQTRQIRTTAETMSTELLYLKFLQGIPLVGVVGGASNSVYLQKVLKYAKLKYHQRFLSDGEQDTENQD
ncbi:MAG: EcsC family protein, partial [Emergencia sp.]